MPVSFSDPSIVQAVEHGMVSPTNVRVGASQKVVAIIPAYNEERFIGSVVLQVRQYVTHVIVVDDGSTDHTAQVAEAAGAQVFCQENNYGKGAALTKGFSLASLHHPDAVVTIDADGQHCAEELPRMAQPILEGQADIVIGSRYLQNTSQVPRHRVMGHRLFNLLTTTASGVSASDSQSGYRAFSPRALPFLDFNSAGFSVESEMQFIAHENRLRLIEVPITIRYPDKPKRPVVSHGLSVLNGLLRIAGQYRPLLFFGFPGAILLIVGLVWGLRVVDIYNHTQQLAVGYAMISVLLSIIGMLGLSTGVILHSIRGLLLDQSQRIQR